MAAKDQTQVLATELDGLLEQSAVDTFIARCEFVKAIDLPGVELLFARFKEDSPDLDALAEFLTFEIVNYVVPLKKRRAALAASAASASGGNFALMERLSREARRKFIEFDKRHPGRASEIGELLAYLVAQKWLGAFQVASKMALKTSSNMPVHGLDGIHAKFQDGVLVLYFLESKLAASASKGMSEFCASTKDFASKRKQYLLEYTLIADLSNFDALSEETRELAMDYFDIYGKKKSKRLERTVGVVCYSETGFKQKLTKTPTTTPADHERHFAENFAKKHEKLRASFQKCLDKNNLDAGDCTLWLVAVPDKDALREAFARGTGS